ncbi:PKD domain-containing protein [Halogeometricum sp. S1BR25-6]|uniref:PKD domain-containing protein n=1 Tax=Halogeometricum salsisoli TaxID=2950536 RepID=A0ABU2GJ36_9EURY|nr:PKD domain-containing protein [Halogeometricum sp. S1BR25-6]MDS0300841.1 PKD domain-containing protein [Halogeometricum sp. S1BR25-6]
MKNKTQKRYTKTAATLVALTLVLSVFGPIGTVAAVDGVTVSQQANSTTVSPGDTITFTTEVGVDDAQIQAASIGLQTDLPDGWTVTSRSAGNQFIPGPDGWLWFAGTSVSGSDTVQYTVAVPNDAATGDYDVDVTASTEGGESTTDTTTVSVTTEQPNTSPVADAGADQTVDEGASVTLDASGSSDADSDALTYAWTQTGGPSVSLSDDSSASPTFTAPDVENDATLTFEVEVADGNGGIDTDTVSVTVEADEPDEPTNTSPVADAGADQTADEGTSVMLDASGSSDADSDALTYAWTQTGGPSVTLSDASAASPTFTAPDVENDATLTFEVEVADGNGGIDTDTVTVTVEADESDAPVETGSTTVSLSPEDDLLGVNQTGSYDIVVDPAAGGVGAYSITVSLSDSSVGTITDVELAGDGSLSDVQMAEDGSSVTIEAVLVDTNDTGAVTLGTVSVQGVAEGETDLVLDVETLGTESGEAYDVTEVDGATLTVSTLVVGDSAGPAIDADGDGVHEDVNGDGVVNVLDVQTLFAARNGPTTTQNPDAFDFNGDGQFDVLDVQWLYYNEVA